MPQHPLDGARGPAGDVCCDPIAPTTRLTEESFCAVTGFTCAKPGHPEEPYEKYLSDWITDTGPRGALAAVRNGDAEVFLYFDENDRLIGFGSINAEDVKDEESGKILYRTYTLPSLAVHTNFRGQKGPPEARFGHRIMLGLLREINRRCEFTTLLLYVDPANPARQWYPTFGFEEIDAWPDPEEGGRTWIRMRRSVPVVLPGQERPL